MNVPTVILAGMAYRWRADRRLESCEAGRMHEAEAWAPVIASDAQALRALSALLVLTGGASLPSGILKAAEIVSILLPKPDSPVHMDGLQLSAAAHLGTLSPDLQQMPARLANKKFTRKDKK